MEDLLPEYEPSLELESTAMTTITYTLLQSHMQRFQLNPASPRQTPGKPSLRPVKKGSSTILCTGSGNGNGGTTRRQALARMNTQSFVESVAITKRGLTLSLPSPQIAILGHIDETGWFDIELAETYAWSGRDEVAQARNISEREREKREEAFNRACVEASGKWRI